MVGKPLGWGPLNTEPHTPSIVGIYTSSHKHGSQKWVPPIVVAFQIQPFFHFHYGRKRIGYIPF